MPAKTKRQKLLAEKHRQIIASAPSFTFPVTQPAISIAQTSPVSRPSTHVNEFTLERRDMMRTILLGLTAIAIEFGLFWYSAFKR